MCKFVSAAILAIISILAPSCSTKNTDGEPTHAVYHWKSGVYLGDAEKEFIAGHNVKKVYLRFFDIRESFDYRAVPDAEVRTFQSDFPNGTEIVPCVFVTLEALDNMANREKEYARKIYNRIDAKCKNGNISFNEIQLDCDWTETTRNTFFNLCKELKALTETHNKKLSATIRLHQLSQPNPDIDRGVLMVYNVGELKNPKETNSILRSDIVKQYLDNAPEYQIPLDVAYPVFSWGAVFNGTKFRRLTRIDGDPDTMPELKRLHDNIYTLQSNISQDVDIDYLQTVRYEMASFDEIMKAKRLVEDYLGYKPENTILYHLDDKQFSKYTPDQIRQIYE